MALVVRGRGRFTQELAFNPPTGMPLSLCIINLYWWFFPLCQRILKTMWPRLCSKCFSWPGSGTIRHSRLIPSSSWETGGLVVGWCCCYCIKRITFNMLTLLEFCLAGVYQILDYFSQDNPTCVKLTWISSKEMQWCLFPPPRSTSMQSTYLCMRWFKFLMPLMQWEAYSSCVLKDKPGSTLKVAQCRWEVGEGSSFYLNSVPGSNKTWWRGGTT